MREIVFRGKWTYNGEWKYGIWLPVTKTIFMEKELGGRYSAWVVDEMSVGECTWVKDKNGNMIFENDYVKSVHPSGEVRYGEVRFHSGAFVITYCTGDGFADERFVVNDVRGPDYFVIGDRTMGAFDELVRKDKLNGSE